MTIWRINYIQPCVVFIYAELNISVLPFIPNICIPVIQFKNLVKSLFTSSRFYWMCYTKAYLVSSSSASVIGTYTWTILTLVKKILNLSAMFLSAVVGLYSVMCEFKRYCDCHSWLTKLCHCLIFLFLSNMFYLLRKFKKHCFHLQCHFHYSSLETTVLYNLEYVAVFSTSAPFKGYSILGAISSAFAFIFGAWWIRRLIEVFSFALLDVIT